MRKMSTWAKRIASAGLSLALIFSATSFGNLQTVQAASTVTRASIHDGAILHAFCWNFNTIKDNMADIAAAGYTAVQTSPINDCLSIHDGMALYGDTEDEGRWYYHYQPTDWKIGNYQLGTRDEFKAMCDEADKYGIGIIVDIDPNHTTPVFDQVSDDLKSAAGGEDSLYHIGAKDGSMSYDNRISVTYDAMGGLPDVDTENAGFQNYFYEFLQDCIACGADGFRIDTAKHIALPDDGVAEEYAGQEDRNNFYPNMKAFINENAVKSYNDLFVYGEVLDGDAARLAAYQDMLGGTCASNYGGTIRTAVSSGSLATKKFMDYKISDDVHGDTTYKADENKLVTWVESHDNYINDKSYNSIDDTDVILGWAVITARKAGTPLFFSRPDGSSKDNPWGNNLIGPTGSDIYKDPQVVAVNKFRTEMVGEDEYLRNPSGNNSVLMIERGHKGVVIVNATEGDFNLESETNLANGNYTDSVEGHDGFYQVTDGVITGTVPAQSVVVLDKQAEGDYSTLFFYNYENWGTVNATVDGTDYACTNTGDGWWKVTIPQEKFKVVFTDGNTTTKEISVSKTSGKYMSSKDTKVYASKADAEAALGVITKSVYFFNTKEWKTVYAYGWYDGGQQIFGGWPGMPAKNEGSYWWKVDVKMLEDKPFFIIFSNGEGSQTENIDMSDESKNYIAINPTQSGGNLAVTNYSSKEEVYDALNFNGTSTTVYFYNEDNWDEVGVYTWEAISLGDWPGQPAEYEGDNWWKLTIDACPADNFNIIFNNMGNGLQTDNLKVDSLEKVYFRGNKKYASKKDAEDKVVEVKPEKPVEEEPELLDGEVKVYYHNEDDWDELALYAWTEGDNNDQFLGGWPGKKMQHIGKGWYSVSVPADKLALTGRHLIINNNGNGSQHNDIEPITDRPSDEELGKAVEEPTPTPEPTPAPAPAPQPSTPSQPSGSSQIAAPAAAAAQAPTQVAVVSPDVPKVADTNNQQVKATTNAAANTETAVVDEEVEDDEAVEEESNEEIEDTADTSEELQEKEVTADAAIDTEASNEKEKQFPVVPVAVVVGIAVVAGLGYVGLKGRKVR